MLFAYDETMRISRQRVEQVRSLPAQFAPVRPVRWPWLIVAALIGLAIGDPDGFEMDLERSAVAHELQRNLGR